MSDLEAYVDDTGETRRLGCLEPTVEESGLCMASSLPSVSSSRWQVVTHEECKARVEAFLQWYLLNQRSHGSCVGFSGAGALMWDLWAIGQLAKETRLSGAYIYSWINGGRDRGASIPAALDALKQHGTCLESTVGWDNIYRRGASAGDEEAKRFRLETGMTLYGFESIVSALQVGKPVQFGIRAGRGFDRYDDEGCCAYLGRGSNHSVFAAPLLVRKQGGGFKAPMINSWGNWGPWRTGWCYVDRRHLDGGGGGFIHGTPSFDPELHVLKP